MVVDRYTRNMLMSSGKFTEERDYWLSQLGGELVISGLPTDFLRKGGRTYQRAEVRTSLESQTAAQLVRTGNGSHYPIYMILLLGVYELLHRYTGQTDMTIGMPGTRQHQATAFGSLPLYALRFSMGKQETVKESLLRIKDMVRLAHQHRNLPFDVMREELEQVVDETLPLFRTVVSLKNVHQEPDPDELRTDVMFQFDLQADAMELVIHYNAQLYEEITIGQVARHLQRLLGLMVMHADRKLSELDILLPEEQNEILHGFNETGCEYPRTKTLHQLFLEQAKRSPDNVAVISPEASLTYRELDERSNRCAHYLRQMGVAKQELVGIIAKRTASTLIYMLAILKVGAAYVPIDPDYPEERRLYMLQHSQCRLVLDDDLYVREGIEQMSSAELPIQVEAESLCYVIYTSGSTGLPKGVAMTHRALINTIVSINRMFSVQEQDRMLGISSFCFDLSVYDVFGSLSTGAAVILVPDQREVHKLVKLVDQHHITIWNSVPALLHLTVQYLPQDYINLDLRLFLLSGDWIPLELHHMVKRHFPHAQMISLGGATEAAIWSIYFPVQEVKPEWTTIPYGRPLPNQQFFVLSPEGKICPYGVEGELHIGGDGVAVGYYHDPVKTEQSFVQHPELGRLYKTGDFGFLKREGYIKLNGRKDFQVKIGGYRIETEGIQAILLQHESIHQAYVTVKGKKVDQKVLIAYVVARYKLVVNEIKEFLQARLPKYMIPSEFILMEHFPLSANGKVDVGQLLAIEAAPETGTAYEPPQNETEEKLAAIFAEVLGMDRVGVLDEFFGIGGNSMKCIAVSARVYQQFQLDVPPIEIARTPTVRQVAALIERYTVEKEVMLAEQKAILLLNQPAKQPLFAFPGLGGYAVIYARLAKLIDAVSFYSFDYVEREDRIEHYIHLIQEEQPEGPYRLFGYSAGGNLAFEVAHELIRRGHQVEDLILVDSLSRYEREELPLRLEQQEQVRQTVIDFVNNYSDVSDLIVDQNHLIEQAVRKVGHFAKYMADLTHKGPIDVQIHLIQSEGEGGGEQNWQPLTSRPLMVYQGSGPHDTMVLEPEYVMNNALLINTIFQKQLKPNNLFKKSHISVSSQSVEARISW